MIGPTEVSFAKSDGNFGAWTEAGRQAQKRFDPTRFSSGWMPIPAGTTRARFRPISSQLGVSGRRWMVRDIEVWAGPRVSVSVGDVDGKDKTATESGRGD